MSLHQDAETLIEKSQLIAKRMVKFLEGPLERTVTSLVAIALAVAMVSKKAYQQRSKIVGLLLLVGTIVLTFNFLNQIIGPIDYVDNLHGWFMQNYHWSMVLGVISLIIMITWEYISPTLRTLFGGSWTCVLVWGLTGVSLAAISYVGLPDEDIAFRGAYASAAILYVVALAIIAMSVPPKGPAISESAYIDDNPIDHKDSELYETQKRIVADIKYLIESGKPSVFAITGDWGIGKTFLLIRAWRKLGHDKSIIWMFFEPWRYASEEALICGFYQGIGAALATIPGVQYITKPLTETADKFVRKHDGTGIFGDVMDVLRVISESTQNPEDQMIEELLKREGKRLVIVIDDVERSFSPEQIFRTLQLALYAKNIYNVQVVFLYDKNIVLNACPEHYIKKSPKIATEYLEKFVGVEVFVPSPNPSELRQLFSSLTGAYRNRVGFDFSENDLPDEMLHAVATPRRVIQLANEFISFRENNRRGRNES